jgi:hypothetical protein
MNRVSKWLTAAVVGVFLGAAPLQMPPAVTAAPRGLQAGAATAAPKPARAGRVHLGVNAPVSEVAGEIIRVLEADGFRLVRRKPNALVFHRPADAAPAGQAPGAASGDAVMRVVVKLKETAKGTRVVARMALVTGPGPGQRSKTRVTDVKVVQGLEEALRTARTRAES